MPVGEDLTHFFNPEDFATPGTFTTPAGDAAGVAPVILDAPTGELFDETAGRLVAVTPSALVRTADVAGVARGYLLTVGAETFVLVEPPAHSGTGVSMLKLRKQ